MTQATLPLVVTEHASHTTAAWNALITHGDQDFEASRLGSQLLYMQLQGIETYIFKFSGA